MGASVTETSEISELLRDIESAVKNRPGPTITGGQLSALISDAAPDLDVRAVVGMPKGPGALKAFLRRHLPELVEPIGRQGADVLYRVEGRDVGRFPLASAEIWRTFVSPSSPNHLVLDRGTGLLSVRDADASMAGVEGVEIAKASAAEHDVIRAAFTATLPEETAAELQRYAGPDADFAVWIKALRQHKPQLSREWGSFRRRRLSELFINRIESVILDVDRRRTVLDQVASAEAAAYSLPKSDQSAAGFRASVRPARRANAADPMDRIRQLAHAVIDLLGYDDLRSLRVPLGALLDAMQAEGR